jgi:hypothetical protein
LGIYDNKFLSDATCPGKRIDAQEEPRFYYDEKGMAFMQAQRASSRPRRSPRMASKATTWACNTERKWASELLKQLVVAKGDAPPPS